MLARHRFDEIQPNTVADLLIALLWDRLASGRYRGPSLATVLRRRRRGGRRACPTNLSALDRECHTLLAFDHYRGALRRELLVFCRACARLRPRRRQLVRRTVSSGGKEERHSARSGRHRVHANLLGSTL